MASSWDYVGEISNVAQLSGVGAVQLIGMIGKAASTAKMHKKNCRQFAHHLKLIGNLLDQLKISELKKYPETREPLEHLEDALRRSYVLVTSCQGRSYLYLLAMGWNIVHQFKRAQDEIDRYLRIIPLITLVDNARIKEKLAVIEKDQNEYTLEEEDKMVKNVIVSRNPSREDTLLLKKSLSCSYPTLPFDEVLKKEKEMLQVELQRSQANLDVEQCEVIHHLIAVTESVASSLPEKSFHIRNSRRTEQKYSDGCTEYQAKENTAANSRNDYSASTKFHQEEWHSDLLGCCTEPVLCIRTLFCPCGTIAKVASAATNRSISSTEACHELMAYSLILSCCCYTCCIRRKLRNLLKIKGGLFDDFLSHLLCCCCALVQEHREIEIRGVEGTHKTKTCPPSSQHMEYG